MTIETLSVPQLTMNNGRKIPQIGFGMWQIGQDSEAVDVISQAIDNGYRHFDSAQLYENETELGEAVKKSKIERGNFFLTTKIGRTNFGEEQLLPSFDESLKKLQTDYVDLLLLHFPVTGQRQQAWKLLEQIYGREKARSIGVSNYTVRHLKELLNDCDVKPAVNQVEISVFLQQPELVKFCQDNEIVVEAYSPLTRANKMSSPILETLAKKHSKTTPQIMLRWCVQAGTVPLPKSSNNERQKENIDIFDFELDEGDMMKLVRLNQSYRIGTDPADVE